ncbi:helix-turn-helix transcriptional regulator [Micromonospora rifamycinica]|uniref:helix-turn-helix domain-containing protein n=1 Tax=Micromonospora rifamycinica TaxID=291594 RepID=UPI0034098443
MPRQPGWDYERFMTFVYDQAEAVLGYRPNASELAAAAGIHPSAVSRWTYGSAVPSTDNLLTLAEAFKINPATLYALVGLLPEAPEHMPPPLHPLAGQVNRMLLPSSRLSQEERVELEVVLRRAVLAFGGTPLAS